ncbi:MAG: flagellar basal body P-ring formation chaperone FlgA [Proteobacteria bacterium]|nr:flagellar basal body P-ring formation chaperone FlgA [Pseudomonadota bacterium]
MIGFKVRHFEHDDALRQRHRCGFEHATPMLTLIFHLSLLLTPARSSAIEQVAHQDLGAIVPIVETFIQSQIGNQSTVTVKPPDPRLDLPACSKMEVFLPAGSKFQGRVTAGVRCFEPSPWTIYVQAQIATLTRYVVAAVPLAQGHVITENDVRMATGELGATSAGFITDMAQAVGRTVAASVSANTPIRPSLFRKDWVVRQGQAVRLFTTGAGFRISLEVKVLANASEGESVQVKTKAGRILTAIARSGGIVELAH